MQTTDMLKPPCPAVVPAPSKHVFAPGGASKPLVGMGGLSSRRGSGQMERGGPIVGGPEESLTLVLTAKPSFEIAAGLEGSLAQAKQLAGPHPTTNMIRLVKEAEAKLAETRAELVRCARLRKQP